MEDNMMYMVLSGLFTLGILVMLWPRARHMMKHSPKGSSSDWISALIPLLAVIGFVVLLIMAV